MARKVRIRVSGGLLGHQRELVDCFRRRNLLVWGAQAGKTRISLALQAIYALGNPLTNNIWVDRDGKFARKAFRLASHLIPAARIKECSKIDLCYRLENGAEWWFYSGLEPDAFRGDPRHSAVFNEAAYCQPEGWTEVVAPRMRGWALFNTTPKGTRNWTFGLWQDAERYKWFRSQKPSAANPTISPAVLLEAKLSMPEGLYRQEILAEFVSDLGRILNPCERFWSGAFEAYDPKGRYAAGIDWAKVRDWSAWAIRRIDTIPHRLVDFGRLPHMDYTAQVPLLAAKLKQYGDPPCLADASEQAVNELMRQAGARLEEFRFTAQTKLDLVGALRIAVEKPELVVPRPARTGEAPRWTEERERAAGQLADEITYFEPHVTRGSIRYEAQAGHNDDLLMAVALSGEAAKRAALGLGIDLVGVVPFEPDSGWS